MGPVSRKFLTVQIVDDQNSPRHRAAFEYTEECSRHTKAREVLDESSAQGDESLGMISTVTFVEGSSRRNRAGCVAIGMPTASP